MIGALVGTLMVLSLAQTVALFYWGRRMLRDHERRLTSVEDALLSRQRLSSD